MNPLGINLWNWRPGLDEGCIGLPTRAAKMGFTAVELPMTTTCVPQTLADEIRSSGLKVSLCAALGPGRDLSSFDHEVRADTMKYLTDCLKIGQSLGATVLAGPLYAGSGKCHRLSTEEKKREWELAVTGLKILAKRAEDCGIELALEPLNRYRTSVVNTTAQGLAMVRDIGANNVGLHFDTFHACLEEKDLLTAWEQALTSGKVKHFHACANNRGAPGQGVVPWKQMLDLLVCYGYTGHITMETFAPGGLDSSWVQVHEPPDQLAKAGIDYMQGYFANL